MHTSSPKSLRWTEVLTLLRACAGETVLVRDGKVTEPAASIRNRPAAKGTELCLFTGEKPAPRLDLIEQLEAVAERDAGRLRNSARANVNKSYLLIESVGDETIGDGLATVVQTRRPVLGYNPSQQTGSTTTLRSKRIKTR